MIPMIRSLFTSLSSIGLILNLIRSVATTRLMIVLSFGVVLPKRYSSYVEKLWRKVTCPRTLNSVIIRIADGVLITSRIKFERWLSSVIFKRLMHGQCGPVVVLVSPICPLTETLHLRWSPSLDGTRVLTPALCTNRRMKRLYVDLGLGTNSVPCLQPVYRHSVLWLQPFSTRISQPINGAS